MKIIFNRCIKIKDHLDLRVKERFVKSKLDMVNDGKPIVDYTWPDFTIEIQPGDTLLICNGDLEKIKKSLGAMSYTIIS